MIIAIPDDYQQLVATLECYATLKGNDVRVFQGPAADADQLARQLQDAETIVLIRERTRMTGDLIARLPRLKHIAQTGRSTHHIDVAACTARGIAVSTGTHASVHTIAEYTWALILASLRDIPTHVEHMRRGDWSARLGLGVHGKTLGVHGFGKIGSLVAAIGKSFGMRVIAWGGDGSRQHAREAGCDFAAGRQQLYAESDVLSLHLRLTDETRHSIRAEDLAQMKRTALLVNTARADVLAPGALVVALRNGRPGFAAVDVYDEEPVVGGSTALLEMSNVICTPHLGYAERGSYEGMYASAVEHLLAFAAGKPTGVLNPTVQSKK